MTMISFDARMSPQGTRRSATAERTGPVRAAVDALRRWRSQRRQERALEALPFDMRKDLGWPTAGGREIR